MLDAMNITDAKTEAWFDDFVATLRAHQLELDTGTASPEIKKFYEAVFSGNADKIVHMGKSMAQKHFVTRMIVDFAESIKGVEPIRLAFYFNDSEVLVWAEINDDDDVIEQALLKAEAKINAKYHPFGFDMETTIIEKSDKLGIPNHYKIYKSQ